MPDVAVQAAASVYAVLGALLAVPQLVRLVCTRRTEGLSLPGWMNGCLSYGAWLVYYASEAAWPLLLGAFVAAIPWVAVTVILAALGGRASFPEWVPVLIWGAVLLCVLAMSLAGYRAVLGVVLAFSALWAYGPSLVQAWKSVDVSGLSPATWSLGVGQGIAAFVAGWGLWAAMAYGLTAAVLCVGVLMRIWRARAPYRVKGAG